MAAADAEKVNSVFALPDVPADQRFIIQYTSGTTSRPKGVVLTRRKVQQNALGVIGRLHVGPADRIASVSPFFHTAGTSAFLFVSLLSGAQLYTLVGFEPERVLQLIEKERVSVYVGVETLFTGLAKSPGFSPERVESIRTGWTTGSVEGLRYIHEVMGIPGIVNVFGMTEAAPVACMPDSHDPVEVRRTSGYPLPDTHIRVVDPSTGRLCEDGQPGLIEILGPCVTEGYYDKPQETADAFTSDGWLKSGDRGVIDTDGNLVYLGRDKDILRVGGENVAPAEVEQALLEYDDVTGAAVLGKPHDLLEEVPVAFITVRPGHTVDLARLAEFLSVRLASFKVPRTVKVVAEFPMTGSQKIKKYELRGLIDD
ncbi:MAG: hypothetical protein ABS81_00915 [Pseudonocardia sp. SCN 72-86]|nr:MAG: hypothetical protein ABS81_00915 [Pseudonocardia sp. SCN 72-86]